MKQLFWLLVLLAAAVLASFAASNRAVVSLALWPSVVALDVPLYLAVLATLAIGFVLGALSAWTAGRRRRREVRRQRQRIAALEHELAAMQAADPGAPSAAALTARH